MIIISYDMSLKYKEVFQSKKIRIAIVDEAHYLKNPLAKRTDQLVPYLSSLEHIILLTGTPALARPKELFSLLRIIRPDIFQAFKEYGNRYCDPKPSKWSQGIDYDGSSNAIELHYLLNQQIMIRRLKKDVLKELPQKRRQKIHIQTDPQIVRQIQAIFQETGTKNWDQLLEAMMREKAASDGGDSGPALCQEDGVKQSLLDIFTKLYILTGKAKIKGVLEYIDELLENDIKFIIFAHHIEMLDEIEQFITKKKIVSIRIDGSVNLVKRQERVKAFQEDSNVRVAVLSLTAAGVGFTLTASSNIIFAEVAGPRHRAAAANQHACLRSQASAASMHAAVALKSYSLRPPRLPLTGLH